MKELMNYELQILREIAGLQPVERVWGAAIGAALESLKGRDYITAEFGGKLTEKGWAALGLSGEDILRMEKMK